MIPLAKARTVCRTSPSSGSEKVVWRSWRERKRASSALSGLLTQHGLDVVGEAADGEEAIGAAGRLRPDLILLDLSMPGLDGLSALPRLREAARDCEVVVLTASGTEENLLGAIRGGAAGYLLKSEPPERIVGFLRGVANGEAALSGVV